jgi:hypothetical protein
MLDAAMEEIARHARTRTEARMGGQCGCGARMSVTFGCLECGAACCPACAIPLESAAYCGACARSLMDVTAVRAGGPLDLH